MARSVKRNVTRTVDARQAIVREYMTRPWYALPDWAVTWFAENIAWIILIMALILAPVALLAIVLGFHSLPLEFLGIPASSNGVGSTAVVFLAEFVLLALAVRPLFHKRRRGWQLVLAAAAIHLADSLVLQHAISGILLFGLAAYIYWQTRRFFKA